MNSLLMLQNAHLRMCVDSQGGSLLSLVSLQHQQAILREGHGQQPGDCGLFPMLPVANRVAEIVLCCAVKRWFYLNMAQMTPFPAR